MSPTGKFPQQRAELRQDVLQTRAHLDERADKDARIESAVRAMLATGNYRCVHSYVSTDEEVSTRELIAHLIATLGNVVVPDPAPSAALANSAAWAAGRTQFRIEALTELESGRRGILGPSPAVRADPTRTVPVDQVELFIVPGIVFDRRGFRLGYGSGFYDRLLALASVGALRVGLAYQCQVVAALPVLTHDVPMDIVVTEDEIIRAKGP